LSAAGQHVISDACHKVAIAGGFSVPDQITVKHHSSADVVFPHLSAAMEFFQATNGGLWIGGNLFHVRPPRGQAQAETSTRPQQDAHNGETPTDTLVVRGIGDMTTRQLGDAFAHLTPRLKRVNIPTDKAGKSRGLGWVTFFEIEEAELVYQRLKREGCMLSGRRVSVKFHEPDTIEGMVELQALKKRSLESIEASHTQALKGPNADMWKSYLAMFQQPAPEEPKPKHAKSEAFNATMPDLQTERAEEFPSGMGNMGGSMPPLFPMPTNLGGGGGGWLGLT
jgi:RNA recognition motif-containing protein